MTRHLQLRRGRGEDGAALALALVFMVLVGVLVFYVLGYAQTSIRSSQRLDAQRRAVYAVDSAIRGAIQYVQEDPAKQRGSDAQGAAGCGFTVPDLDGQAVTVTCNPYENSGAIPTNSSEPGFAILTMAPFHGLAPTSGCKNIHDELGLVQVQSDKLLRVTGNVYVNSDADSDTWSNNCPNTSAALHIQVTGNVRQAESCHDVDVVGPYTNACGEGLVGNSPSLNNKYPAAPDPAIANPAAWAPNFSSAPPTQTVPGCPPGRSVLTFTPGTYNNVAALNALTNGACPNKLFYFEPGDYYFNFGSSGTAPWTINDPTARIVGGTPNGVLSGGGSDVGPITLVAANPPAPTTTTPGFDAPLTDALTINGNCNNAANCTTTGAFNTGTRSITLGGFKMPTDNPIPDAASNIRVQARVAHFESGRTSQLGAIRLQMLDPATQNVLCEDTIPRIGAYNDPVVPDPPLDCLTPTMLNNGTFLVRYSVEHTPSTTETITSTLDGIELQVTYSTARVPWNPSIPSSITPTSPEVPGACVRDGDYGFSPTSGVQWVFGGESRILLRSGRLELCPSYSNTHQEIVLYSVKDPNQGGGPGSATLRASGASGTGWSNTSNGTTINGSSATSDFSGQNTTTRTITLSNFTASGNALNIPAGSTIDSVTARIAHNETGVSGSSSSTAANRINNQTITLRPASGSAWSCTVGGAGDTSTSPPPTQTLPVGCAAMTVDNLNAGIRADYSVTYQCSSSCGTNTYRESLDGIELDVVWTPPSSGGGGGLAPASGCIVKAPYYNPSNHAPAYNGACALLQVASDANGGSTPRVIALWGTVYAPSAAIDVPVDILTVPVFNRGVLARILMLGYNLAADAAVPITTAPITSNLPVNRRMTFTADISGRSTKVVADVEFCDSPSPNCPASAVGSAKILSWKVTR